MLVTDAAPAAALPRTHVAHGSVINVFPETSQDDKGARHPDILGNTRNRCGLQRMVALWNGHPIHPNIAITETALKVLAGVALFSGHQRGSPERPLVSRA